MSEGHFKKNDSFLETLIYFLSLTVTHGIILMAVEESYNIVNRAVYFGWRVFAGRNPVQS